MDPERQPLLGPSTSSARCRNTWQPALKPLTSEEVKASGRQLPWRRVHLAIVVVFWGSVATLVGAAVCLLVGGAPCGELRPAPALPATYTLAPLISRTRFINHVYTT